MQHNNFCLAVTDRKLFNGICLVLILVDSFLRYPQLDKMPVFYVLGLVVHLCFIS